MSSVKLHVASEFRGAENRSLRFCLEVYLDKKMLEIVVTIKTIQKGDIHIIFGMDQTEWRI